MNATHLRAASALAAMTLALSACGHGVDSSHASSTGRAAGGAVTNCGEKVVTPSSPRRVVTMTPGLSDLVVRLGGGSSVIGEAQSASGTVTPGLAKGARVLSKGMPPKREKLLAASPDLVISPTGYEFTAEQGFASKDQLKKAGSPAYISTGGCLTRRSSSEVTDLLTDIDNLGTLLGRPDGAKKLRTSAKGELDRVDRAVAGKAKPTVAQVYVEGGKISAIGAGVEHDIIKRAGGRNLFNPTDPEFKDFFSADISKEALLVKNPEVIVYAGPDEATRQQTRRFLEQTFPTVKAVQNKRLIALDSDKLMPGVWGNIESLRTVAKGLHPDASV